MPGNACWYKAVIISCLLHFLLLIGGGWMAMRQTVTPIEEQYTEMELGVDAAAIDVPSDKPKEQEATWVKDAQKETTLKQPPKQGGEKRNDSLSEQLPAKVTSKDIPEQMLSHYTKEQLNLALAQYNQALSLNSRAAFTYSNRGQVYYDKGELDKAFADFTQALKINPRLASAHIGRGFIFIKKDQWDFAMDDFDQAVRIDPQNALAYYGRALCFTKNGDKQKAVEDFRSFIQYAKPEYNRLIQIARQVLTELGES